ncbi:GNAT family N-acetyltransferase [Caviibacterium pharyngocola]|uniref:GNAT family N-acetyltransferase n=1 Tax=Caviibacterium pharyngocola TaxID=28159 RepID=A0A2M8RTL3_9PAST|nr:GNAT family N-acetyltransferase [Caviibacterium pharyngocola]PJG82219.1 GNAT family N-acetyltransferase [Caviibacterium pharyngocola]
MWRLKTFKQLSTLDLFRIYKARTAVFVVEQECPYQEVDDKDLISSHLFTEKNDEIIAYCRIIPGETMYIGRVLVAKNARGTGLARSLMLEALNYCQTEHPDKIIRLQAQAYLENFYRTLGFKPISDIYLEDGIPHLDMESEVNMEKTK